MDKTDIIYLDDLLNSFNEMMVNVDESLAKNDVNSALKQVHECMALIKREKERFNDEQ